MNLGNLGAAAGGVIQGMDDQARLRQMQQAAEYNQFRMDQARREAEMQQAARASQQRALGAYQQALAGVYGGGQPPVQSPMPGQPSVPMAQPAQLAQGGGLPPYRGLQSVVSQTQPMQPVQLPPRPAADQGTQPQQGRLDMQTVMKYAPKNQEDFANYMNMMTPMMAAQDRAELEAAKRELAADKEALNRENITSQIAARNKGEWSDPFVVNGVTVQRNNKTGQIRTAVTRAPAGARGGAPALGSVNQFLSRETKDLAPITDAQKKASVITQLLDTGNPVGSNQVQQALSDLYSHLRATTQIYSDNKSFGDIEQRFSNMLNRFVKGQYSDEDVDMIKKLVSDMNTKVYAPARQRVVDQYKKQAKATGVDPSLVEMPDVYGAPTTPIPGGDKSGRAAPPAGFEIME